MADVDPEQSVPERLATVADDKEIYDAFRAAGLDDSAAYRATQAVRIQAGQNIVETLELHRKEVAVDLKSWGNELRAQIKAQGEQIKALGERIDALGERVDALGERTDTKISAVRTEIRTVRWLLLALIALIAWLTALGVIGGSDRDAVQSVPAVPAEQTIEAQQVPAPSAPLAPAEGALPESATE